MKPRAVIAVFVLAGFGILAGAGWVLFKGRSSHPEQQTDLAVELLTAQDNAPSKVIAGILSLTYRETGKNIQITIRSKSNPAVLFDRNQDHRLGKEDLSYTAVPVPGNHGNNVCVALANAADNAGCSQVGTSASVRSVQDGESNVSTWTFPKVEISSVSGSANFVVETYHPLSQEREYYPATPFRTSYRIEFAPGREAPTPVANPGSGLGSQSTTDPGQPPVPAPPVPISGHVKPEAAANTGPEILQFAASQYAVPLGSPVRLEWKTRGTTSVRIDPGIGTVEASGSRDVSPSQTTSYLLTATGTGGSTNRPATVTVISIPAPVITEFTADAMTVNPGGSTALRWSVAGQVSRVAIDPLADNLSAKGERFVNVVVTTNYMLTATGPGGTASAHLTLHAATVPPPVIDLQASSTSVRPGETVTLMWNVSNASDVSLSPAVGKIDSQGSQAVQPTRTVRYVLQANGPGGSATKGVTITVSRPAGPTHGQLIWSGDVRGVQLITIDGNHANVGSLQGELPGVACILQPENEKKVGIVIPPMLSNNYQRLVFRVNGNGPARVVIDWALQ